jgi:nitroimidazol reductase NimA-like FMN-containing flavoprotein (pyridoxamine 5'-phosphate oxidase superfamily)
MTEFPITERTRVKRLPKRAVYERERLYEILDEALVCHVGFIANGQPFVIPTGYGRRDDQLYIHGSAASRMLNTAKDGVDVCVTVTLLDGLVLARSAFHHSMNYRSAVVFGRARAITDEEEKRAALRVITEHIVPGRWKDVRAPTAQELKATLVLGLEISEASAKVRSGPPIDDDEDYQLPIWGGVLPLHTMYGAPVDDGRLLENVQPPEYLLKYRRPGKAIDSRLEPILPATP